MGLAQQPVGHAADNRVQVMLPATLCVGIWRFFMHVHRPRRTSCSYPFPSDHPVTPVQFDGAAHGLDNLVVRHRDTQVMNCSRATFGSWCEAVSAGEGWRDRAWPLPLHAVAGFVYGVPLADDNGEAAAIRDRMADPPPKLRDNTREALAEGLPEYRKALGSSARRGEGWLFHELAGTLAKVAYASWFAAEGCYLPFPKHLDRWVGRLDLDRELAHREQLIWRPSSLMERQRAVLDFAEGVVALANG
ncbi:MAG: hypothetical protein ACRDN0_20930 [Trebonia sp.]